MIKQPCIFLSSNLEFISIRQYKQPITPKEKELLCCQIY